MAKIDILAPFVLSWEGGYNKTPGDKGGATNKGVTIGTWRRHGYDKDGDGDIDERDVELITEYDAVYEIMKPVYWDKWQADKIECQAVANLVVDWYWNSGIYGIKIPQKVLGVTIDGKVGPKTLSALNSYPDQKVLFQKLWKERREYFQRLAADPTQRRFLSGWISRLNGIGWNRLVCNGGKVIEW